MITIELHDCEDVEAMMEIFHQIGHHFPCICEDEHNVQEHQHEDGC